MMTTFMRENNTNTVLAQLMLLALDHQVMWLMLLLQNKLEVKNKLENIDLIFHL